MKKKSASKSAFFNLRVLIGLCIALAGISLALVGLDAFAVNSAPVKIRNHIITASNDPLVPVGFDCSTIEEMGIDKMEDFRAGAIMIACGSRRECGLASVGGFFQRISPRLPKNYSCRLYGAADVDLITGTETSPNIIQSETYTSANPDNPNRSLWLSTIHAAARPVPSISPAYRPPLMAARLSPGSLNASGHGPFANTDGDPVILYNKPTQTWFTVWLDTACGGQGWAGTSRPLPRIRIAGPISAFTPAGRTTGNLAGPTTTHPLHFANRCTSPGTTSMLGGGALEVTFSTDNGATWHAPVEVTTTFIRDVQITGDKVTGDVYIAGMDEGGGNG